MNMRSFSSIVLTVTLLLPLQFLLGMAVNLFVQIPNPVVSKFFDSARGVLVILHIINAIAIVTLAVTISLLTRKIRTPIPFVFSIFASLFIVLAITSGAIFLFLGQIDAFSYTMSIGLAGTVVLYTFMGRALQKSFS